MNHVVFFQIVVLLVLVVTGSACPLMGDPSCSPVDDLAVRNDLQQSNVKVHLAVSATLGDLLNNAGRFRWFYGTVPLYSKNCNSNGTDVCSCNLTRQSTTYGTPLCSWNYTCDYNRNRDPTVPMAS